MEVPAGSANRLQFAASISIDCYPGVTPNQNSILRISSKYLILLGAGEGIRTLDPNLGKVTTVRSQDADHSAPQGRLTGRLKGVAGLLGAKLV
jgi:hypothetical protein